MTNHETAPRFRRRAEIEAVQWTGSNTDAMSVFCSPFDFQTIDPEDRVEDPDRTAAVRTHPHGGWVGLKPGDWVVREAGRYTTASDEEFRAAWEPVPAAVSVPPPAPRADVLRWAADMIDAETRQAKADEILEPDKFRPCRDASAQLRRLADEADYVATPCDFVACEPGGEPCSVHERLMAHAEGDHELCGPECGGPCVAGEQQNETPEAETQQQPVPGRNFAAYQAAIVRVALVLREAREHREQTDPSERQDCVMCGADHFAEIRDAIKGKQPDIGAWQAEAHLTADDLDELEAHLESTGETIAELNETIVELTQRAARAEAQQQLDIPASTAPLASGPPLVKGNCPACRHASLFLGTGGYPTCSNHECLEPDAATTVLEQYANEAHPPAHTWKVESPRRDKWASWGATYDDREWASERYESAIEHASGRAFRLVRATTTYTVEAEHQPAAARQDAPLVEPCPPGCVACATDESHDPAAGVRQDGAQPE